MNSRREQVWVGLFLLAAALLIGTALSVAGTFSRGSVPQPGLLQIRGGLQLGVAVRFGGMKAGSVQAVRVGPRTTRPASRSISTWLATSR